MINVCFPFVGDSLGGSHKSSLILINHLDKKKYNPIIVLHERGLLSSYFEKNKIKYIFFPLKKLAGSDPNPIKTIYQILKNFLNIQKFLKKNKINIVHTNDLRCNLSWSLPSKLFANHVWHQRTILSKSFFWIGRVWTTFGRIWERSGKGFGRVVEQIKKGNLCQ